MARKRITELFPCLIPLRKKQKTINFYIAMNLDKNKYSQNIIEQKLPYKLYETKSLLLNKNSGHDMKYQYNKVHNLHLAAATINHVVIYPGETFSFWKFVKDADKYEPYKEGLLLLNGNIVAISGGGLCQISNMLFWMFLHTPLKIVERHGHAVESFPPTTEDLPHGIDATVTEGWLDLKVRNDTNHQYQLNVSFDDDYMYGSIYIDCDQEYSYYVFNKKNIYFKKNDKVYQTVSLWQRRTLINTGKVEEIWLYDHTCEIGYNLGSDINILSSEEYLE